MELYRTELEAARIGPHKPEDPVSQFAWRQISVTMALQWRDVA